MSCSLFFRCKTLFRLWNWNFDMRHGLFWVRRGIREKFKRCLNFTLCPFKEAQSTNHRWYRIRSAGVDSGRILRFPFGPDPDSESTICEKPDPDSESLFHFGSNRSLFGHFLGKTWVNYGWIDDCSRNLNRSQFLKLKKFLVRIGTRSKKFWNRSGLGVWKSDSNHLWYQLTQI